MQPQMYSGPVVHNTMKLAQYNRNKPQYNEISKTQRKQTPTQWT